MFIYGLYAINSIETVKSDLPNEKDMEQPKFKNRPKSYSICETNSIKPGANLLSADQKAPLNCKSFDCLVKDEDSSSSVHSTAQSTNKYQQNLMKFEKNVEKLAKKAEQERLDNFIFNSCNAHNKPSQTQIMYLINNRRNTSFFPTQSKLGSDLLTVNECSDVDHFSESLSKKIELTPASTSSKRLSFSAIRKKIFKNFPFHGSDKTVYEKNGQSRKNSRTSYNELVDRYNFIRKKNSSLSDIFARNVKDKTSSKWL